MTNTSVDILSSFVRFVEPIQVGKHNLPAYCPFHKSGQEEHPSFYVYVGPNTEEKTTGSSFCHRCVMGWSLSSLLRQLHQGRGVIQSTLSQLGITGTKGNRKAQVLGIDRELDLSNPQLPEHILGTYEFCPTNLLDSGFHKDTLRHFDIGFDLMNARITYPLRDHLGRLVGISGRTVVGAPIRYKIYKREVGIPKYAIHKQRILWNYDTLAVASNMGHPPDSVILLEGFKAVMWLYQHGWPGGVCGLGTAVSDEQVELLARLTDTLFVFFDNDLPGISATHRASKKLKKYFRLRFANYPEENGVGLSPDDLTKEQLDRATINYLSTSQWMARYQPILRTIRENKRRERTKQRYA